MVFAAAAGTDRVPVPVPRNRDSHGDCQSVWQSGPPAGRPGANSALRPFQVHQRPRITSIEDS